MTEKTFQVLALEVTLYDDISKDAEEIRFLIEYCDMRFELIIHEYCAKSEDDRIKKLLTLVGKCTRSFARRFHKPLGYLDLSSEARQSISEIINSSLQRAFRHTGKSRKEAKHDDLPTRLKTLLPRYTQRTDVHPLGLFDELDGPHVSLRQPKLIWPKIPDDFQFPGTQCFSISSLIDVQELSLGIFAVSMNTPVEEGKHQAQRYVLKHKVRFPSQNIFRRELTTTFHASAHLNIVAFVGLLMDEQMDVIQGILLAHVDGPNIVIAKALALRSLEDKCIDRYIVRATRWSSQIRAAIDHLHSEGLAWGDAKPDNILVDGKSDDAIIVDFGGGTTMGWVSRSLRDTVQGDEEAYTAIHAWLQTTTPPPAGISENHPIWQLYRQTGLSNPMPTVVRGDLFEGGGQILRIAICMSVLLNQTVHITNIRSGRPISGMTHQTTIAAEWLADASGAFLYGSELGSSDLTIVPTQRRPQVLTHVLGDEKSSIGLLFQAIVPYLLLRRSSVLRLHNITFRGLTHERRAPTAEYMQQVLIPTLSLLRIPSIEMTVKREAWAGTNVEGKAGEILFSIQSLKEGECLPAFSFSERGTVKCITATIAGPSTMNTALKEALRTALILRQITTDYTPIDFIERSYGGSEEYVAYILLVATTSNGYRLGTDVWIRSASTTVFTSANKSSLPVQSLRSIDSIVKEFSDELEHESCLDKHMQDQIEIFKVLAGGKSEVNLGTRIKTFVSQHTLAARATLDVFSTGQDRKAGMGLPASDG